MEMKYNVSTICTLVNAEENLLVMNSCDVDVGNCETSKVIDSVYDSFNHSETSSCIEEYWR